MTNKHICTDDCEPLETGHAPHTGGCPDKSDGWEKEFDERFVEKDRSLRTRMKAMNGIAMADGIKSFIRTLLASEREKAIQEGYLRGRTVCIEQLHGTGRDVIRALVEEKVTEARKEGYEEGKKQAIREANISGISLEKYIIQAKAERTREIVKMIEEKKEWFEKASIGATESSLYARWVVDTLSDLLQLLKDIHT